MFDNIFTYMDGWTVVWIAAVASSVIGFGFLLHSTYIAWKWPKATGHVTGNKASIGHYDSGQSIVYFAEITFTANDRRDYTVRGDVGIHKPWQIGEPIKVHYKPGHPAHAMTMKPWQRLVFAGSFIAAAIVCWGLILGLIER
jgi:hypothetical protein